MSTAVTDRLDGYPAYAGIDLIRLQLQVAAEGLPRIRGDRPLIHEISKNFLKATPHTRGSTHGGSASGSWGLGYPAYAGIDHIITTIYS